MTAVPRTAFASRTRGAVQGATASAHGGVATISTYDVYQSNGVIHVVQRVLLPM
jgi:uncharacterized surface protein with fasciclin (FAS1) repeats